MNPDISSKVRRVKVETKEEVCYMWNYLEPNADLCITNLGIEKGHRNIALLSAVKLRWKIVRWLKKKRKDA